MLLLPALAVAAAAAAPQLIATVIIDDMGAYDAQPWNLASPTPTLGALAAEGVVLSRHYTYTYCSPTRRSFLTGRFPVHISGVQADICSDWTPLDMELLSSKLGQAGYDSHFIGKTNTGFQTMDHLPVNRGFASHVGFLYGAESYHHGSQPLLATRANGTRRIVGGGGGRGMDSSTRQRQRQRASGVPACRSGPCPRPPFSGSCNASESAGHSELCIPEADLNAHSSAGFFDKDFWNGVSASPKLSALNFYSTNFYTDAALKILRNFSAVPLPQQTRKLWLHLCYQAVHSPFQDVPDWEKSTAPFWNPVYRDMLSVMDTGFKNITEQIKGQAGLWDTTLMVIFSDNGGPVDGEHSNNWPLRGSKESAWEGGTRVAAMLSGGWLPARLRGTRVSHVIHVSDWFATLSTLVGVSPSSVFRGHEVDSVDVWPMITDANATNPREFLPVTEQTILWKQFKYFSTTQTNYGFNGWSDKGAKLHNNTEVFEEGALYDVVADMSERVNIAAQHPQVVARMAKQLATYEWYTNSSMTAEQLEGYDCAALRDKAPDWPLSWPWAYTSTSLDGAGTAADSVVYAGPCCKRKAKATAKATAKAKTDHGLELTIDESQRDREFLGYGVNPSAGTYRLLHDYPEPQRSEILDFMFKPNFAASFHRIKVEIGGDGQGTDGSEASHMRSAEPSSANFTRGYAWWLLREARKRNPSIETYGLAESWPRWVCESCPNNQGARALDEPMLAARYIVTWVKGAKDAHGIEIDWVGMWNEHWETNAVMFAYAIELRKQLDAAGLQHTKIIGPDAFVAPAEALANATMVAPADGGVGDAIAAIGVHGAPVADPANPNASATYRCGLPLYASEDGSTYGDPQGGLVHVENLHGERIDSLSQGSNYWNPWSGYYPGMPFALHSLMDAHHPWSGHYRVRTPIWAAAHMNQHTKIGMSFLKNGFGVGDISCGSMLSYVTADGADFTTTIERNFLVSAKRNLPPQRSKTNCVEEQATFTLRGKLASLKKVAVWLTVLHANATVAKLYERQPDVAVAGSVFKLSLPVNSIVTITSMLQLGQHCVHPTPPAPKHFPVPYAEDFEGYPKSGGPAGWDSNIAKYFADMSGGFEVHGGVLRQMTPQMPIGWFANAADYAPYTIIGAIDLQNVTVSASVLLPASKTGKSTSIGWVAARVSQAAEECDGVGVICSRPWGLYAVLDDIGELRLHLRLLQLTNSADPSCVFKAKVAIAADGLSALELTIVGSKATLKMNGQTVADGVDVSGPHTAPGNRYKSFLPQAGFAALGGGPDYSTSLSFDNFSLTAAAGGSGSKCGGAAPAAGMPVVSVACGLDVPGLAFDIAELRVMPRLDHTLCITSMPPAVHNDGKGNGTTLLALQGCSAGKDPRQDFLYNSRKATIVPANAPPPKTPSPWEHFTPGQGINYGAPYKGGDTLTAVRHLSISHAAPFAKQESLEFLVNGVSQGVLKMPTRLPADAVGCIGSCSSALAVTAVGAAFFDEGSASHGAHVSVSGHGPSGGGLTATFAAKMEGCNEVALLGGTNLSYSVKLSAGPVKFNDFGWCSPSLMPFPSSALPSGWMGEQGTAKAWIYRSGPDHTGLFKASNDPGGGRGGTDQFCLAPVETTDRGQVRPYEPATLGPCGSGCGGSSWTASCGAVFYDAELGLLRAAADTTGLCFGVCGT